MIDPSLAFQTALRASLLASLAVLEHVKPDNIRAGAVRPDRFPAVILSDPRVEFLGCASGSQRLARVAIELHIWGEDDGQDTARKIGGAVYQAIEFGPKDTAEIQVDEWHRPTLVWLRDPQPSLTLTHGVMALEAVVRWRA